MKYWSCCQRKTSEFDNFLNQEGCTEGKHMWCKKDVSCLGYYVQTEVNYMASTTSGHKRNPCILITAPTYCTMLYQRYGQDLVGFRSHSTNFC